VSRRREALPHTSSLVRAEMSHMPIGAKAVGKATRQAPRAHTLRAPLVGRLSLLIDSHSGGPRRL